MSILTVEQRLAIYEKALEIFLEGILISPFSDYHIHRIRFLDKDYSIHLCKLLRDVKAELGLGKRGNYESIPEMFPEFYSLKPDIVGISEQWWPNKAEGIERRKEALKTCIEICKTKIK